MSGRRSVAPFLPAAPSFAEPEALHFQLFEPWRELGACGSSSSFSKARRGTSNLRPILMTGISPVLTLS